MTDSCGKYDAEEISRYVDGELSSERKAAVARHIRECERCGALAGEYGELSAEAGRRLAEACGTIPAGALEESVIARIREEADGERVPWWRGRLGRLALQVASLAVIMVLAGTLYFGRSPVSAEPSAIVNYVEGEASSVMIFETGEGQHTVIWYTET